MKAQLEYQAQDRCATCRFFVPDTDVDTGARCRSQGKPGFTVYPDQVACIWYSERETAGISDPRVHISLNEGVITFDVIAGDKTVFSFSMDESDLYDAITNVEHLQPCALKTIGTQGVVVSLLKGWIELAEPEADFQDMDRRIEFLYQMSIRAIEEMEQFALDKPTQDRV